MRSTILLMEEEKVGGFEECILYRIILLENNSMNMRKLLDRVILTCSGNLEILTQSHNLYYLPIG